jgi:hypothetical protein
MEDHGDTETERVVNPQEAPAVASKTTEKVRFK